LLNKCRTDPATANERPNGTAQVSTTTTTSFDRAHGDRGSRIGIRDGGRALSWMTPMYSAAWMVFAVGVVGVLYTKGAGGRVIREAQTRADHTRVGESASYGMICLASEVSSL